MKYLIQLFSIIYVCVFIISCGSEGTGMLVDNGEYESIETQKSVDPETKITTTPNIKTAKRKTILGSVDVPIVVRPDSKIIVDPVPIENNTDELDLIDVVPDDEIDDTIVPVPVSIHDDEKPVMTIADIGIKQIHVEKYEVSIEAYCKVFPHMRDVLLAKIRERHVQGNHGIGRDADKYPALVTYDEAVRYADAIGRRLPTTDEWVKIARGNGNKGKGNHGTGWICLADQQKVKHVDRDASVPNGYGVYEMTGNVSEWCQNRRACGIYYRLCEGNIHKWFPIIRSIFNTTTTGFRCVQDVE